MKRQEKGLSAWQLTMMALGTVIGGSFFLGSSVAIRAAGPCVLLGFIFGAVLVYFILFALSEMSVANPGSGSFQTFAAEAYGEGAGFVTGWVYWTGMVLAMSSEATAVSILVRAWLPGLPLPLMGSAVIVGVTGLNLLGADRLSKLESWLASVKIFTLLAFILTAVLLIAGLFPGRPPVGLGALAMEGPLPGGPAGLAGSLLIVMFSYAGFEIIGLAASEAQDPKNTVPKAIRYTVFSLVSLYILAVSLILPLIPTADMSENVSPIVGALHRHGIQWAGTALHIVLVSAILSTMLAAMFGLGRMMRSLADKDFAPRWLRDRADVPYRGILASGGAMLLALGAGLLFPEVYLFLVGSGGFALLFSYIVIMATHIRFRKRNGCPGGKCQLWGYPYTSAFVLVSLVGVILSMPFVQGQASGLLAGILIVLLACAGYMAVKYFRGREENVRRKLWAPYSRGKIGLSAEISEELTDRPKKEEERGQ